MNKTKGKKPRLNANICTYEENFSKTLLSKYSNFIPGEMLFTIYM